MAARYNVVMSGVVPCHLQQVQTFKSCSTFAFHANWQAHGTQPFFRLRSCNTRCICISDWAR